MMLKIIQKMKDTNAAILNVAESVAGCVTQIRMFAEDRKAELQRRDAVLGSGSRIAAQHIEFRHPSRDPIKESLSVPTGLGWVVQP